MTVSILSHNRSPNQSCLMHTSVCPVIDILVWEHLITVMAAIFLVCEVNLLDFSVLWGDIFRSFPSKFYPLVSAHIYVGWIIIWWLSNDYFLIPSSLFISWHSTMRKYLVCLLCQRWQADSEPVASSVCCNQRCNAQAPFCLLSAWHRGCATGFPLPHVGTCPWGASVCLSAV